MMIEYDDVETQTARLGQRHMARRAAIDANEKRRPRLAQGRDCLHIRAVALENPVRNVDQMRRAGRGQEIVEKRSRRRAIDVVIAEDGDRLSRPDRRTEPRGRRIHVGKTGRIRQELAQGRVEIGHGVLDGDPPPREHSRQKIGEAMMLHHGEGLRLPGRVEPRTPGPAKGRAGDPQQGPIRCKRERLAHAPI